MQVRLVNKSKTTPVTKYHGTEREAPVAIYVALKFFASVRSETLIERLFHLGICIPYKRVLQITKHMSQNLLKQYERDMVFVPKQSCKSLFTVMAKDNIDLNAAPANATGH